MITYNYPSLCSMLRLIWSFQSIFMPEVNEVKGRAFVRAFIVTMVKSWITKFAYLGMSVCVWKERAVSKSRRSYLLFILSAYRDFRVQRLRISIVKEKERKRVYTYNRHNIGLYQRVLIVRVIHYKEKENERGKKSELVYILISYSIKLIIPHRFDADRISYSRRSINV